MKRFGILLLTILVLTGCKSHKIYDDKKIAEIFNDYDIYDLSDKFTEADEVTQGLLIDQGDFHMFFYTLKSDAEAIELYNYYKEDFQTKINGLKIEKEDISGVFSKYTLNTDGKYMVIIKNGNTAMSVDTDEKYKDDVDSSIKRLGY